jgi:copper chaperone NosL
VTRPVLAVAALIALIAGTGCGVRADGPPHLEEDRTACAHCGMLVSERMFAAAYRTASGEARVFDDIGCLLKAARAEPGGAARFWFHDAPSRTWIDGSGAHFIHAASVRTPMAGGMLAYADSAAAAKAAAELGGRVIGTLDELLKEGVR